MKALSIMNPWAYAIMYLCKPVENRTWYTHFRGQLLIHAGKRIDTAAVELLKARGFVLPKRFDRGGIVGSVEVIDCIPIEQYVQEYGASDWAVGPYCLVLRNPKPAKSFQPCRGQLGIFNVMKQKELI